MILEPRHLPNLISVLRIVLVVPVVHMLLSGRYGWALVLFVLAGVSDGLDGFLAKHYGWQSRLGSFLDPAADKLLLLSCFVVGAWQGLMPLWLVAAVVLRDLLIVFGASAYYLLLGPYDGQPLASSKINTFLQLFYVFLVLSQQSSAAVPDYLIQGVALLTLATTLTSGAFYVKVWGRNLLRERGAKKKT